LLNLSSLNRTETNYASIEQTENVALGPVFVFGSQRPLDILCLEDKIVQQAVVFVLEAIYEADFLGFSYGFRPGRGQHDALDALHAGLMRKRVSWCHRRCGRSDGRVPTYSLSRAASLRPLFGYFATSEGGRNQQYS